MSSPTPKAPSNGANDSDSWSPSSWRSKPVAQPVIYPDETKLKGVLEKIQKLPPLVSPGEIERLRHQLAQVQNNQAFLLHAGDCAESFEACTQENISNKIGLILSFSLILVWGARMPIVRIGRIAGQYAKPRSSPTEKVKVEDGTVKEVPSFRLSPNDREPDPQRLLSAYFYSTTTLNYVRSLLASGFASLNNPRDWSLNHVRSPALRNEFETISNGLADAIDFCRTIGAEPSFVGGAAFERGGAHGVLSDVDLYTSHEGLMLDYEEALTRYLPIPASVLAAQANRNQDPVAIAAAYNTSAHFLWVGDRTRQLTGAHIEYFRGIRNPIGVKVGPSMKPEELVQLLDVVNPAREDGKITLITRYGADKIDAHLAGHIEAVQSSGHPVIWVCDPMHGNGLKTRHFSTIVSEVTSCLRIHTECGSRLGGISLEFTGELNEEGFSVTECLGGSMELSEEQLGLRYQPPRSLVYHNGPIPAVGLETHQPAETLLAMPPSLPSHIEDALHSPLDINVVNLKAPARSSRHFTPPSLPFCRSPYINRPFLQKSRS
ncbi:hypothetical protein M407DRAFT_14997 [Tulasnella calospora MUT 4182]|uniref:Phospho-2-dehydro-3-deoxyheptonate aldolase n=1 Tax=Tulasnella calospora MUT 4182 TaxID=1051891 RepID=A0A0C3QIU0_9AGAM|nr:hypothetical protein M407DRAFT_14997 [Tulasnella calospora MUT 4182]